MGEQWLTKILSSPPNNTRYTYTLAINLSAHARRFAGVIKQKYEISSNFVADVKQMIERWLVGMHAHSSTDSPSYRLHGHIIEPGHHSQWISIPNKGYSHVHTLIIPELPSLLFSHH